MTCNVCLVMKQRAQLFPFHLSGIASLQKLRLDSPKEKSRSSQDTFVSLPANLSSTPQVHI